MTWVSKIMDNHLHVAVAGSMYVCDANRMKDGEEAEVLMSWNLPANLLEDNTI